MSRLSRWLRSRREKPARPLPNAPPTPYDHLLYVPRFEECVETLLEQPFRLADGSSFYASYREIFLGELYRFPSANPAPRIVDCGANCGVSVVYFKQLFPAAKIIAVEADPAIFALLEWNVSHRELRDVTLINKAVAVGTQPVTFHREGADAGRIHTLADTKEHITVPVVSLDELLCEPVDMLKIDIEGAETDVLCKSERLQNVAQLMVEYHSFGDTPQALHELLSALASNGFRYYVQSQFCPARPLVDHSSHLGMDLQLNIFGKRAEQIATLQDDTPRCGAPNQTASPQAA